MFIPRYLSLCLCLICLSSPALAVGTNSTQNSQNTAAKPLGYARAVQLIKAEEFAAALPLLAELAQKAPKDADIQNWLGFAFRKTGALDKAAIHYEKALAIDPDHKGALEYQGEMYLQMGNRTAAEANLARLRKICFLGCEALDDLEKALAGAN